MACHGEKKAKGKLRLHTKEVVQSADGLIVPKDLDESELIYRITLPLNDPDDEKMPPSDEPNQLTPDETWLIKWWVFNGASYDQKLSEVPNDDVGREPLLRVLKHYALNPPGTASLKAPPPNPNLQPLPPPRRHKLPPKPTTPTPPGNGAASTKRPSTRFLNTIAGKCHGESRASAKLRLHTPEGIQAGGKNGQVVVAGNPKGSLMIERMHLPEGGDERMPPTEENRQLKPDEISLITWWIQAGAPYDSP